MNWTHISMDWTHISMDWTHFLWIEPTVAKEKYKLSFLEIEPCPLPNLNNKFSYHNMSKLLFISYGNLV